MSTNGERVPKYEAVAASIAAQIVKGRYPPGYRLHGRSTLASLYKVSPETIRKAMALLHRHGVVEIQHGAGVQVLSQTEAQAYLDSQQESHSFDALLANMGNLVRQQRKLAESMEQALRELAALVRRG